MITHNLNADKEQKQEEYHSPRYHAYDYVAEGTWGGTIRDPIPQRILNGPYTSYMAWRAIMAFVPGTYTIMTPYLSPPEWQLMSWGL